MQEIDPFGALNFKTFWGEAGLPKKLKLSALKNLQLLLFVFLKHMIRPRKNDLCHIATVTETVCTKIYQLITSKMSAHRNINAH